MDILAFLVLGGVAGWIASIIMGTEAQQGAIGNILLGIVGGLVGGLMMNFLGAGPGRLAAARDRPASSSPGAPRRFCYGIGFMTWACALT